MAAGPRPCTLNILITTPTYPPYNSGLGNAVQQQAAALTAQGLSVVVATGGAIRQQRLDEVSGALVEEFNVRGADSWVYPLKGDVQGYEQFLIRSHFEVILLNAWQTWSTDLCIRNRRRIAARKVVYSHCVSTNVFYKRQPLRSIARYLLWRPYWWTLPQKLRELDGLIFCAPRGCDSRFDDLSLAQRLRIPYKILPNALSPEAIDVLARPALARVARQHLIVVGSYTWLKGHDFALRAYALSKAKNRIPLKIFGPQYSAFTTRLRRLAMELAITDDYIKFHEGTSSADLAIECSRSIALLFGSHTECQPLVLLDALAAGTPFVARATGCIPFLHGGITVHTEVEAGRAIDELIANEETWTYLSGLGRATVARANHPSRLGTSLAEYLKELNSSH